MTHTLYKEHKGSYAVAVPYPMQAPSPYYTGGGAGGFPGSGGSCSSYVVGGGRAGGTPIWHTLFSGLSLQEALFIVRYLNGGSTAPDINADFMRRLGDAAA